MILLLNIIYIYQGLHDDIKNINIINIKQMFLINVFGEVMGKYSTTSLNRYLLSLFFNQSLNS